ncbi:hypothetical protein EW145_g8533, partial [Phellinidium pouzarii]
MRSGRHNTYLPSCQHCYTHFETENGVSRHLAQKHSCREKEAQRLAAVSRNLFDAHTHIEQTRRISPDGEEIPYDYDMMPLDAEMDTDINYHLLAMPDVPPPPPPEYATQDEDGNDRYVEDYDGVAGMPMSDVVQPTQFEFLARNIPLDNSSFGPFVDEKEWDLAKWIMKSLGKGTTDELLKTDFVSSWDKQSMLPEGATIVPVIIASDETQLSTFSGDKTAWPVYLTIGNIAKNIRLKPSTHATVILGYLPKVKFQCFEGGSDDEARSRIWNFFHHCMRVLLVPLIEAGENGIEMLCADGFSRIVFPILAAYVADYPEQCLVTCCKSFRCPKCVVPRAELASKKKYPLREPDKTLELLRRNAEPFRINAPAAFITQGLRPMYPPFWADLPHCNIFAAITPDLL